MERSNLIYIEGIIRGIIILILIYLVYLISITLSPDDPMPLAIILAIITSLCYVAGSIWYTIYRKKL